MDIDAIRRAIRAGQVRVTDHADEEARNDGLSHEDVFHSAITGELIEDYPTDWPYPSGLIFGKAANGQPIHSFWAYNEKTQWAVLVTVYRPDPARWSNWRERRPRL